MLSELRQRWGSVSPPFFQKVRRLGVRVGALGAGLLALPPLVGAVDGLHASVTHAAALLGTAGGHLVLVGGAVAAVAGLAVDWNKVSPDDVPAVTPPQAVALVKEELDLPHDAPAA